MKLRKYDIFPAPPVPEAVPPTASRLEEILAESGERLEVLFSLGNVFLREGKYSEAVGAFERALSVSAHQPEIIANYGIALAALERNDEALARFRESILLNPSLALPHIHSGRVQLRQRDYEGAQASFERAVKLSPTSSEPLLRLAEIAEALGDQETSLRRYREAFAADPELADARTRLARDCFDRGRESFDQGDLDTAFRTWAAGAREYAPAFAIDQHITTALGELEEKYLETDELSTLRHSYGEALRADIEDRRLLYPLFTRFLFTIGLFPEAYEAEETIEHEISRWRLSLDALGEHPYPHFRLGLLHCYAGRLLEGEAELQNCNDKLPPKKQATLKLSKILRFVGELKDIEQQAKDGAVARSPDWEWEAEGFDNPFELKQWKQTGLEPKAAKSWKGENFSAAKAKLWSRERVVPAIARQWVDAGHSDPKAAKKWIRAGASPDDAARWSEHFAERVEQAIQCRSVGFAEPKLAAEWLNVVLFPWDAIRWHEAGFAPQEAVEWLERGVTDPFAARERRSRLSVVADPDEPTTPELDEP